MTTLVFKF